jgi:integral membrane sensor domain MASE1
LHAVNRAGALEGVMGSIVDMLNRLRDTLMLVIGSLSLAMLTLGGISYVTAGAHESGFKRENQTVKHALLGLAVAILAPVLIQIIKTILGLKS